MKVKVCAAAPAGVNEAVAVGAEVRIPLVLNVKTSIVAGSAGTEAPSTVKKVFQLGDGAFVVVAAAATATAEGGVTVKVVALGTPVIV